MRYIIYMKRFLACAVLFLLAFGAAATSPAPTGNSYGGVIFFKNTSLYNVYMEIDLVDDPQGGFFFNRLCLEKNDTVMARHTFFVLFADDSTFDRNTADPNNYFKSIRMYDMDTGALLREFHAGDKIFTIISGNVAEDGGAHMELAVTDTFLTGGA